MLESHLLKWLTSYEHPLLDTLVSGVNNFNHVFFYFIIISVLFWAVHKQIGFGLLYLFTGSMYLNVVLKDIINTPDFPNGKTQAAATFWGFLIPVISRKAFTIFTMFIIFLVALSQLYMGANRSIDIFGALLIGFFLVYMSYRSLDWIGSMPDRTKLILAVAIPFALLLLSPKDAFYAGLLIGLGVGYILEQVKNRMVISKQMTKKLIACAIGIMGLIGFYFIGFLLPSHAAIHFLHAILIGLWITLIAPLLFVSLSLYTKTGRRTDY